MRRVPERRLDGDDGSVLLLVIGFAGILVLMVGVVVNVSAVVLAKRSVSSAADGAAVSAAQALSLPALYSGGLAGGVVPLDPVAAGQRVAQHQADLAPMQPGLELRLLSVDGGTAVVRGTRTVRLPFRVPGGPSSSQVAAEARARAPVIGP